MPKKAKRHLSNMGTCKTAGLLKKRESTKLEDGWVRLLALTNGLGNRKEKARTDGIRDVEDNGQPQKHEATTENVLYWIYRHVSQSLIDGQLGVAGIDSGAHVFMTLTFQVYTRRVESGCAIMSDGRLGSLPCRGNAMVVTPDCAEPLVVFMVIFAKVSWLFWCSLKGVVGALGLACREVSYD
ncbi:hypothetical protein L6452_09206 [Arctium lappa]|uniref:Uncharacterized protein n=1 Tax=Arctium lappa TaxID=4217 RepID=A0ACB9DJY1_ARCLA|nr:hypothetical protein L6452_09206 [Arctium lappa]